VCIAVLSSEEHNALIVSLRASLDASANRHRRRECELLEERVVLTEHLRSHIDSLAVQLKAAQGLFETARATHALTLTSKHSQIKKTLRMFHWVIVGGGGGGGGDRAWIGASDFAVLAGRCACACWPK
jgi:hypothetical protein